MALLDGRGPDCALELISKGVHASAWPPASRRPA